ncbi:hypothetical protein ACIOTI_32065 [Streptomyces sp. NPDC087843]|uniref:hypothetical protein n=1 Tax=Streptomyces sp. NPDC087843 TaxID=3365804 RepID=UPI003811A5D9
MNLVYLGQDPERVTRDWIGMLPPCKRIEIPLLDLDAKPYETDERGNVLHPVATGLTLRDANGRTWVRHAKGNLSRLHSTELEDRGSFVSAIGTFLNLPNVHAVDLQECTPPS